MFKAQGMKIQLGTTPAHTDQHNSLDQRKQLQTRRLQMLKSKSDDDQSPQISDSERRQSPEDPQAWQDLLTPAQGTKLSPASPPAKHQPLTVWKSLQVGNQTHGHPTRTQHLHPQGLLHAREPSSLGQSHPASTEHPGDSLGHRTAAQNPEGPGPGRITGCHSAPRITTWDHHAVTAAGTFPVSSP